MLGMVRPLTASERKPKIGSFRYISEGLVKIYLSCAFLVFRNKMFFYLIKL